MTGLKAYPEYKDSGIEWLGEAPAHWSISPIGRNADLRNGADYKDVEVAQDGYPVIGSGGEFRRASKFLFDGESVLFGRKGTIDKPLYVNCRFWTVDTMFYSDINQRRLFPKFLYYFAAHIPYGYFVTSTALPSMTQSDIRSIRMGLPPLDEQRAIASFLDHETAEIDAFIADQQELIGLLNERRAATITQAVTKGLDPNVPMKGSGVEWLGEVPTHWSVTKLGRSYTVVLGKMLDAGKDPRAGSVPLPYIRAANIQDDGLDLAHVNSMHFSPIEAANLSLLRGDLLVVEGGSIGTCYVLPEDMPGWSFQKTVNRVRARGQDSTAFLGYLIRTYRDGEVLDVICNRSTIAHLTAEKLHHLSVPRPPVAEQQEIADYLDRETVEIDAAIADAKEAIELSKERRAALISAAVTGKIDVRDRPAATGAA